MADIFRIPGSQYRTQEEENFKGVPRSGEQTYFLPDFIGDVGKGFKEVSLMYHCYLIETNIYNQLNHHLLIYSTGS